MLSTGKTQCVDVDASENSIVYRPAVSECRNASTQELKKAGAGNRTRTGDIDLGKVALYQPWRGSDAAKGRQTSER